MDEKVIQAGMFDQKSTGNERRQFLQTILRQVRRIWQIAGDVFASLRNS